MTTITTTTTTTDPRIQTYQELAEELTSLLDGSTYWVTNLANAVALVWDAYRSSRLGDGRTVSWMGFYIPGPATPDILSLGPFQGKVACIQIPVGKGVCGHVAKTKLPLIVPDVDSFPGHIACDAASRSEIVLPLLHPQGHVAAVWDIDATSKNEFDQVDLEGLSHLADIVFKSIDWEIK